MRVAMCAKFHFSDHLIGTRFDAMPAGAACMQIKPNESRRGVAWEREM
jgi:hypothetical protein